MAAAPRPWIVLRHGPLEHLEENLRCVEGSVPTVPIGRRMTIVKRSDGTLLFHNAVPLEEPLMKELEAWGEPGVLVVPNGFHRLDVHAFKARYPGMRVVCPAPSHDRVARKVQVDGHFESLPPDGALRLEVLDGGKLGEAVLIVASGAEGLRKSLLFGDALFNVPHLRGLKGLILRAIGSTGGPRVTPIARLAVVRDKKALARHLERLAGLPGLARLIPSHGNIVDQDPAGTLRAVASTL